MTFNEMLTRFQSILNRDDCSADQATIFLQDSIARIARDCRLPNMERSVVVTVLDQPMEFLAIPADLIEVIDLFVSGADGTDHALDKVSYRQLLGIPKVGLPRAYSRFQGTFGFRGCPPKGSTVVLLYYGEFSDFATGDSENELSASNPDLAIYGALSFAGDVFEHPSTERWEVRYAQILGQVQGLGIDLDAKGGPSAIAPMYSE